MVAQDGKGPHKGPAVAVQLGKDHINLGKECALEPREWQAELELHEDAEVHEEEGFFSRVCAIISAHGFAFPTRSN